MAESGLDLRALARAVEAFDASVADLPPEVVVIRRATLQALLAHCRALRAALIEARWDMARRDVAPCWCDAGLEPPEAQPHSMRCNRITAVLRGAQDPEGP